MPDKAAKLPDDAIKARIADWIDAGAPYDRPLVDPSKPPPRPHAVVTEADRQFWSFRPLSASAAFGKHRTIDSLIAAKLDARGLAPRIPPPTAVSLIRRASFDLLGLPACARGCPRRSRLDPAPDAFDRARRSPPGRAPPSASGGPGTGSIWPGSPRATATSTTTTGPTAYHYRDFVVRALNEDMPYDRFVRLQVAGDELEPGNPQALMATGFLAAGVHSTQITANTAEKERYDEMDDMAATLGTSMLGLTVGCARCHDHKFDPIPTADYYRLVATFTTTVRSEAELELDPAKPPPGQQAKYEANPRQRSVEARDRNSLRDEPCPAGFEAWLRDGAEVTIRPLWLSLEATRRSPRRPARASRS